MSRIAILGNTAGGKSTLARRLSKTRNLPHIEIDVLFWGPDWSPVPTEVYDRNHNTAVGAPRWIIDGGGTLASVETRVARATELILLDFPLWIHFWRAADRQIAWAKGTLQNPPGGGQGMPPTDRLFEIIWNVDREWMPVLRRFCDTQEAKGKSVIRLTTLDDLAAFSSGG